MGQSVLAVLGTGVVDPATAIVRADDPGLTRGDGCFEGIRVFPDAHGRPRPTKLDRHLARMSRSAAALDIPFDEAAYRDLIAQACAAWPGGEGALKAVLTRGADAPTGFVTITALNADYPRQRSEGVGVITLARGYPADAFAASPWLLGGVKTLSYAINMAAQREAERHGAQDAIFVSADGKVLEATTGSVVWARARTLHTTPLDATGILAGTTQELLFDNAAADGWRTERSLVDLDELHAADTLWIISSVRGPVEVVDLDGKARRRNLDLHAEITALAGF